MRRRRLLVLTLIFAAGSAAAALSLWSCQEAPPSGSAEDGFVRLGPSKPGEWRHRFKEPFQSFESYSSGSVNRKSERRSRFYIQPLGGAEGRYAEVLGRMARFAEAYFGVSAKVLDPIPLLEEARSERRDQYDATRLIGYLSERVPDDALVFIGITEKDLYSEGLNFVFGEASLHWRCGVYSLVRYENKGDLSLFTRRSLKLLAHESGHILSIPHCVAYECVMEGANTLQEHDRQPLHLCPIDLKKVLWNTGLDRRAHYEKVLPLYREWGCDREADWVAAQLKRP